MKKKDQLVTDEAAATTAEEPKRAKKERRATKGKHRKLKMVIAICVAAALCATGLGIGLMFIPKGGFIINEDYGSVSYEVQPGELYSTSAGYNGLDVFGRLNWTFQHKDEWYSSYEGHVYTTVNQDVWTYKQFKDGRLLSADISQSSLINLAREFCYIPSADRVIWREASGGPTTYNGFDTPWETGAPRGNMTISGPEGFKAVNGLPATELSGYVFREETILNAEPVVENEDGTYTITYHMKPEVWKAEDGTTEGAAAYYSNQMKFTGGLTDVPTFDVITISFTFNERWENLKTETYEEYAASKGFTVGCEAVGVTVFSYDTPYLPLTNDYEDYFKQYAQMDATGAPKPTLTSMNALASAFAPVINGPATLSLDLEVNGKPVPGVVYADLGMNGSIPSFEGTDAVEKFIGGMKVRAKFGNVDLWVQDSAAYVQAGDWKVKLTLSEFTDLLGGLLGSDQAEADNMAAVEGEEGSNPLSAIIDAAIVHEEGSGKASSHADLALGGLQLPLDFNYNVDEETYAVSLDKIRTAFSAEGVSLAATLAFTEDSRAPGELRNEAEFTELAQHIQNLIELFGSQNFHAEIGYEGYGFTVQGDADFSVADLAASAALTVAYGEGEEAPSKKVGIGYKEGTVYLDLDGVKLSAGVKEAAELLQAYLPSTQAALPDGFDLAGLLDTLLFTTTLSDDITISGDETQLQVLIKANELLGAFGIGLGGFDLGTVELGVSGQQLSLKAIGASVVLTAGGAFDVDTADYTDALALVGAVQPIIEAGGLTAHVSYGTQDNADSLYVDGTLRVGFDKLAAEGDFTVNYKNLKKAIKVGYTDHGLYLTLQGEKPLKLKVNTQDAVEILTGILAPAAPASLSPEAQSVLEKVFSFRFGDLAELSQDGSEISLVLDGTRLLDVLGFDLGFTLGSIDLSIGETITAHALGITAEIAAGGAVAPDTADFADVTPVLKKIPALLEAGAVTLSGQIQLDVGETAVALDVTKGFVSWKEGLNVYLDATLGLGETKHNVKLLVTETALKLSYNDEIGIDVTFSDLSTLENSIFNIYAHIQDIVGEMVGEADGGKNPLPELQSFNEVLNFLKATFATAKTAEETAGGFDWTGLVQELAIEGLENGLARLGFRGITVDLSSPSEETGLLSATVCYKGDVTVNADLNVTVGGTAEEMPEARYITSGEMNTLLGYIGSAISLFRTKDLTLSFEGTVTSPDTDVMTYPEEQVKYQISAKMSTHRGNENILHLDVDGNNLWVDADVYAHLSINIVAKGQKRADADPAAKADSSLYIDVYMLDADQNGETNGMLDFYVTLSQVAPAGTTGNGDYVPVRLYAPSEEILPILSAAMPLLGIDEEIINNYMVEKWITDYRTVEQLKALSPMITSLFAKDTGSSASPETPEETTPQPTYGIGDYLRSLVIEDETLSVTLGAAALYGENGAGLSDVVATLTKTKDSVDEQGNITYGQFDELNLFHIYDKTGKLDTSLNGKVSYDEVDAASDRPEAATYTSFLGAEKLIFALAKGATHETDEVISGEEERHTYALNSNFYIDGSITADLNIISIIKADININLIALSVNIDENGELGINIRLEYQGVQELNIVAINGDSTVDITIKGGMIYMRREQRTEWVKSWGITSEQTLDTPDVRYRAMPLDYFMDDILNQLGFILNFGSLIMDNISKGGSSSSTASGEVDFGQRLSDVLRSYDFYEETTNDAGEVETPASWVLVLNGDALVKGILGEITVTITEGADGYIHDLKANTTVVKVIKAEVKLRWRNPGGTMEEGASDLTRSEVAEAMKSDEHGFGGMLDVLTAEKWGTADYAGTTKFLEAREKTVNYKIHNYDGSESPAGTQNVFVSTGADGNAENTLYSTLVYPALPADDAQFSYRSLEVSATVGAPLTSDSLFIGQQSVREYEITFYTADETLGKLFGWAYDETQGRYYHRQTMKYGSTVDIGGKISAVTGAREFEIVAEPKADDGRTGTWQGTPDITGESAKFTATYPAEVIYKSAVAFTLADYEVTDADGSWSCSTRFTATDYVPLTPSAAGYTFLGWFINGENGWKEVTTLNASEASAFTVEALWVSDLTVTITKAERSNKTWNNKYDYVVDATITGGHLAGAFADDVSMQMTYRFEAWTNDRTKTSFESQHTSDVYVDRVSGSDQGIARQDQARVYVMITYTYGEFSYTIPETYGWSSWATV